MPTYEYVCRACGEHQEVVQSFTDPPLSDCPACGGSLRKVFGNVGIVFKGSGFYKTDSRTGSSTSSGAKGGGAATSDATSSGSGAETPAAKKEPAAAAPTSSSGAGGGTSSTAGAAAS